MKINLPENWKETSENHFENEVTGYIIREFESPLKDENDNNTYFQILDFEGIDNFGQCFTMFENPFDVADNDQC